MTTRYIDFFLFVLKNTKIIMFSYCIFFLLFYSNKMYFATNVNTKCRHCFLDDFIIDILTSSKQGPKEAFATIRQKKEVMEGGRHWDCVWKNSEMDQRQWIRVFPTKVLNSPRWKLFIQYEKEFLNNTKSKLNTEIPMCNKQIWDKHSYVQINKRNESFVFKPKTGNCTACGGRITWFSSAFGWICIYLFGKSHETHLSFCKVFTYSRRPTHPTICVLEFILWIDGSLSHLGYGN